MLTTVIGADPKPSFLQLPDWFNAEGWADTLKPTAESDNAIKQMYEETESIFLKKPTRMHAKKRHRQYEWIIFYQNL